MKRKKLQTGLYKASAFVLAVLISGLISIVSLSVSRLSFSEIRMARSTSSAAVAFQAAEAGLEQGLLMWRWNRNLQLATTSPTAPPLETTKEVLRCKVAPVIEDCKIVDQTVSLPQESNSVYFDLKVWYKAESFGNYRDLDKSKFLGKDQSVELNVEGIDSIRLKFKASGNPIDSNNWGIEVGKSKDGTDWSFSWIKGNSNGSEKTETVIVFGAKLIRIKPWNSSVLLAVQPVVSSPSPLYIDSGTHYIESTGYYRGTKRRLRMEIDRISGAILAVYDFSVYAGTMLND